MTGFLVQGHIQYINVYQILYLILYLCVVFIETNINVKLKKVEITRNHCLKYSKKPLKYFRFFSVVYYLHIYFKMCVPDCHLKHRFGGTELF